MKLTELKIRNLKAKPKPQKVSDGNGLYLLVTSAGNKCWRYKYRYAGKEKVLALGMYPDVGLAEARQKHAQARKALSNDSDPGLIKKFTKHERKEAAQNTFEALAREWHANFITKWSEGHAETIMNRLEQNVFPWLGTRPVSEINSPELLIAMRRVQARGAIETAHRTLSICEQVFLFAIRTGRAKNNPALNLKGALEPTKTEHHASITNPAEIAILLDNINNYKGHFVTRCAFKLAPRLFLRPGELRSLEWKFVSLEEAEIRIPAAKMKRRFPHIVPLSTQAIDIFKELHALTGTSEFVFPSAKTKGRVMSANTILAALRRLGYASDEMSGHGFRSMANTRLCEQGWHPDIVDRQLAHKEQNKVKAAYNYAQYLPERRKMMQDWSDYLESLCNSTNNNPVKEII